MRMADYHRTTRECAWTQLRPELDRAIREHARQHQLDNLATEVLMCCETTMEKMNTGWLDPLLNGNPDTITYLALLVTPQRLIWARSGDRSATVAASARLSELRIKAFRPRGTEDIGLDVYGQMEGTHTRVGGRLMMGSESVAQKFCETVEQAVRQASPPRKSIRPKWLGG
jgi:hypothetical protein